MPRNRAGGSDNFGAQSWIEISLFIYSRDEVLALFDVALLFEITNGFRESSGPSL